MKALHESLMKQNIGTQYFPLQNDFDDNNVTTIMLFVS